MRIVGGKHKGKRFQAPKNLPTRPTTDFAKEGLFNILQNTVEFEKCAVLDLFAGIGNISFEFASRGVDSIVAVEQNPRAFTFIKKTARECDFPITTIRNEVFRYLKKLDAKFDIIFADPPYQLTSIDTLPDIIFKNELLNKDGMLIVEHGRDVDFSKHQYFEKIRKYGNVNFSFFSYA